MLLLTFLLKELKVSHHYAASQWKFTICTISFIQANRLSYHPGSHWGYSLVCYGQQDGEYEAAGASNQQCQNIKEQPIITWTQTPQKLLVNLSKLWKQVWIWFVGSVRTT